MKRFTKTFFLAASFLAISSCAKVHSTVTHGSPVTNNTPGGGLPSNAVSSSSIQGSWSSACTTGSDANGGTTYTTSTAVIVADTSTPGPSTSGNITTDTIYYNEATCTLALTEELRTSSYTVVTADNTSITETLASTDLKALNSALANLQNEEKYCGRTNWAANVYQTVLPNETANCADLAANEQNINVRLLAQKSFI